MTLNSSSTITDIVTALLAMEGINSKADLASVIGSPSVGTDAFTTLIQAIQTQKNTMASGLTGKGTSSIGTESLQALADKIAGLPVAKWATGSVTPNGNTLNNVHPTGATNSNRYITISGLSFTPSKIVIISPVGSGVGTITTYLSNTPILTAYPTGVITMTNNFSTTTSTSVSYNFIVDGVAAYVVNGGFQLPTYVFTSTWFAIE